MKQLAFLLILHIITYNTFSQNNQNIETKKLLSKVLDKKFSEFLGTFPDEQLPINTKNLNNDGYYSKFAIVKNKLSLKFIFHNVIEDQKYYYSFVDQETQRTTEGFKNYDIRAIFKFTFANFFIICYSKFDQTESMYVLNSYDVNGILKDSLIINNKEGETEYFLYEASYINPNLNISRYIYEINPDIYNKKKYIDKNLPQSKITMENFEFDAKSGKFEKKGQSVKFNKCSVDDFASGNNECKLDSL